MGIHSENEFDPLPIPPVQFPGQGKSVSLRKVIRPACGATNLTARSIQGSTTLGKRLVRKNISVQNGEQVLFDEIRYFFYITNRTDYAPEQIVSLANGRCNQENVIEQLKNGVNAMRMPVDDLLSKLIALFTWPASLA